MLPKPLRPIDRAGALLALVTLTAPWAIATRRLALADACAGVALCRDPRVHRQRERSRDAPERSPASQTCAPRCG